MLPSLTLENFPPATPAARKALLVIISLLLIGSQAYAQEICDNGIDDDGDGLVDLNDVSDCACTLLSQTPSLLPNPSFEEYSTSDPECTTANPNGLPDDISQVSCMAGWLQPDVGTTDAFNLLSFTDADNVEFPPLPLPIPSGTGYAGMGYVVAFPPASFLAGEQMAACLTDGPLTVGEDYRYTGQLGFGIPTLTSDTFISQLYSYPEPLLAIYGVRSCAELQERNDVFVAESFGDDTPWEEITRFRVSGSPNSWVPFTVDFTAEVAYEAIVICRPLDLTFADLPGVEGGGIYYYTDDFRLSRLEEAEAGSLGSVTATTSGCNGGLVYTGPVDAQYTYQWYRNGVAVIGATNASFTPTEPGDYRLRTTFNGECALSDVLVTPVIPDPTGGGTVPDLFPATIEICDVPTAGEPVLVFTPDVPDGVTVNYPTAGPTPGLFVTAAGTINVEVVAECGTVTESINVSTVAAGVTDFVRTEPPSCDGNSGTATVELTLTPSTATWRTLAGDPLAETGLSITNLAAGTYTVELVPADGCPLRDTFTVSGATSSLRIDSIAVQGGCGFDVADLQVFGSGGTDPVTYTLADGREAEFDVFPGLPPGNYSVLATDANGCTATGPEIRISPSLDPQLQLNEVGVVGLGDSVTLRWTAAVDPADVSFNWLPDPALSCLDCPFPTLRPTTDGRYTLQITDAAGCVSEASVTVRVDRRVTTYFPTAFSPNGDGRNDRYQIFPGRGVRRVVDFKVYDRWGGLRYEARDGAVAWDGQVNGEIAAVGVYAYFGVLELDDGREELVEGSFVLMR
ncbi:gliding motility-associated C-terminal domain-containing protein [Lewinella sp. 4G2]|uniref:T9SS type B sorting domain-containing protein n=1 Tax=Lewinella sp. 4G2 TaxID=1803372 RepID=UPI0007B46E29|nr:gliding motility-associated C-terminal domain-containing protein [Lewinella sp. 4G2]OAV44070.1 hypothetical protein A3850_005965 [Lewinella sp. 4G2]